MLQVDWLLADKKVGLRFLETLCSNEECLGLFELNTVKYFTDYFWDETFSYFVIEYFLPFILFGFLPLLIMAFLMPTIDHPEDDVETHWAYYFAYFTCLIIFMLLTVWHVYGEIIEMR